MRTRALARPLLCAALSLVTLLTLAGCGGESPSDDADAPASTSTPADPTSTTGPETTGPETTPTESPQSPSVPPSGNAGAPPARTGLPGRLLAAGQVPGFNDDYRWVQGATGPENPSRSFGTCQRFAVTSIGAERAVVRRFRPAVTDPSARFDRAGELVAQFPDNLTARRAFAVLKAWRARCADRLARYARPRVGALEDVPVDAGTGGWYLLTYGPVRGDRNAQFFDAQGMAMVGSRIAMLSMVLAGQDYNYEAGKEPMVTAVQRAAQLLSSR